MRRLALLLVAGVLVWPAGEAGAWGLTTHRWVTRRALALAESRCGALFQGHHDAIVQHSLEPDTVLKRIHGERERVRHFLDLDEYGAPPSFAALPRDYRAAVKRFGQDVVKQRGTLPWHLGHMVRQMRDAVRGGRMSEAQLSAGRVAHYASDATMPLHATRNHDGQLSDQGGLHGRIENRLIGRRVKDYTRRARAVAIRAPIAPESSEAVIFATLEGVYPDVAVLLAADRAARRGTKVGSARYYARLEEAVGAMLAAHVGEAAVLVAALWEGACVTSAPASPAGRPAPPRSRTGRNVPR